MVVCLEKELNSGFGVRFVVARAKSQRLWSVTAVRKLVKNCGTQFPPRIRRVIAIQTLGKPITKSSLMKNIRPAAKNPGRPRPSNVGTTLCDNDGDALSAKRCPFPSQMRCTRFVSVYSFTGTTFPCFQPNCPTTSGKTSACAGCTRSAASPAWCYETTPLRCVRVVQEEQWALVEEKCSTPSTDTTT